MNRLTVPVACLLACCFCGCENINPRVEYNPYNPHVNRPEEDRPIEDRVEDARRKIEGESESR